MITANIIGLEQSSKGSHSLQAVNPVTQSLLEGTFISATTDEVDLAAEKAHKAWGQYRHSTGLERAVFLRKIADNIEALGEELVQRAMNESGLPEGRIIGERGRTCGQLRLFADLVEEGSWVQATIDFDQTNDPPSTPHLANMLTAVGPVVVFTASNFPLAFSTAGGDTAAALAAGCPVIVKAHESHPGVNALVSEAIQQAAKDCELPDGVFSSLYAHDYSVGSQLVKHSSVKSVAFTGSYRGGMALYKLANERKDPIPVFAEMGSINPIFVLPDKVSGSPDELASQIAGSVNLGSGQFCTNPGLIVVQRSDQTDYLIDALRKAFADLTPTPMLNQGIFNNFEKGKMQLVSRPGVTTCFRHEGNGEWKGYPLLASIEAQRFLEDTHLQEEVFGPFSLVVECGNEEEMQQVAMSLTGQLSAVLMATEADLRERKGLVDTLLSKVGRIIFNGMPTGVAVCHAMQHGGPFPASTDSRFTSVGTKAIRRFVRPVVFQNFPDDSLPMALRRANPLKIWRLVNGEWSKA